MAVENAGAAGDVLDLEPELVLDEIPQRIMSEPGIVVDLGRAHFVQADARKFSRRDLAAESIRRLVDRDLAGGAGLGGEMPRREQSARPPAHNGNTIFRRSRSGRTPVRIILL